MEAITKRPVVRETPEGDVIAIRPVMNMVLAIDHRANDGAQAAAFLRVDQGLARGGRTRTRRSTDGPPMRVVVTGGAGFIGRAVVRQLAARGDHVVALVRDPATGRAHRGPDRRAGRERPLGRRASADRAHAGADGAHPRRRLVPGRHPGVRATGDVRRERRARRSACSTPRSPPACRGSSTSRRSTSSATRTGGSSTRRTGATRPTGFLSYYDETKCCAHGRGRGAHRGRRADRHRPARRRSTGRATTRRSGSSSTQAYRRHGAVHRPRRASASSPSTSTTSPPGSSRRSTAAASGRGLRRSAARTSG